MRAPLPPPLFEDATKLRAAIRHGAGLDMIPMEAATAAGVLVANVPAVNARSVAEHVMFAALALLRRFRVVDRDLRAKGWLAGREHANSISELAGKTIGIVGFGAVGQAVGHIAAHGFDLKVVATTRSMQPAPDKVGFLSIDALVEQSDIIVLCCPLTPEAVLSLVLDQFVLTLFSPAPPAVRVVATSLQVENHAPRYGQRLGQRRQGQQICESSCHKFAVGIGTVRGRRATVARKSRSTMPEAAKQGKCCKHDVFGKFEHALMGTCATGTPAHDASSIGS